MMESMREAVPAVFAQGPGAVSVERDVIRAVGPDSESFLQGQLSQDLAQIDAGGSAFSLGFLQSAPPSMRRLRLLLAS